MDVPSLHVHGADTTAVELTVLSWNLFHGRDFPPDRDLFTWRSRLLRRTERGATHVQVNRELLPAFTRLLAAAEWDLALLQECPPRWWGRLAAACDAEPHGVLTSRNSLGALRARAARLNPDLLASAEGGPNLTLVRKACRCAFRTHEVRKAHRQALRTRVRFEPPSAEAIRSGLRRAARARRAPSELREVRTPCGSASQAAASRPHQRGGHSCSSARSHSAAASRRVNSGSSSRLTWTWVAPRSVRRSRRERQVNRSRSGGKSRPWKRFQERTVSSTAVVSAP